MLHGSLHHRLGGRLVGDRAVVGCRLATCGPDLLDHALGHGGALAGAVPRAAEVVDHHRGALLRQQQGVRPPETPACTSDQRHLAVQLAHENAPSELLMRI